MGQSQRTVTSSPTHREGIQQPDLSHICSSSAALANGNYDGLFSYSSHICHFEMTMALSILAIWNFSIHQDM